MRRRSERKKSTDVVSSPAPAPAVAKRPARRSQRSSSQVDTEKLQKTEEPKIEAKEFINNDTKQQSSEKNCDGDSKHKRSVSPQVEEKIKPTNEPELEVIQEAVEEISGENSKESSDDNKSTIAKEKEESKDDKQTVVDNVSTNIKHNNIQKSPSKKSHDQTNDIAPEKDRSSQKEPQIPIAEEPVKPVTNDVETTNNNVNEHTLTKEETDKDKKNSAEKSENSTSPVEVRKTFTRNKDRRTQSSSKSREDPENDENEEFSKNNSQKNSTTFSTPTNEKTQHTRKRRWLSKKTTDSNTQILAISTDSLKNLISDVHPVPLCDVKLESSSEVEEVESEREEGEASPTPQKPRTEKSSIFDRERKSPKKYEQPVRKISIKNEDFDSAQPVPSKNASSCILYITNLVRPFTVLQLKGLLARTGKIVENRFWIDKIKSKCYVQYETEDEAVETRHALHGVRWPTSNPKCLNVDFGTTNDMEKAMASTQESGLQLGQDTGRENRIVGTGWDRDRLEFDEKKAQTGRPVREWDVGKREEIENEAERAREREKLRIGDRSDRVSHSDRPDKDGGRNKERGDRERDRKRRSVDLDHRRSLSVSPGRKMKKKNNDPPLRLLDDLFRKTKTTPCIYWLPLTPEQIAEKEARRLRIIAEHEERAKQRELVKEKEREKERDREREREKDRRRERDRSMGHRRSNSRDRRRY